MRNWKLHIGLIALVLSLTACGGGGSSSSGEGSTTIGNSLGPLVNAEGGANTPGGQTIFDGDQCPDNTKLLDLNLVNVFSPDGGIAGGHINSPNHPLTIKVGNTHGDSNQTLIQFDATINQIGASVVDDLLIQYAEWNNNTLSPLGNFGGVDQGMDITPMSIPGGTRIANYDDTYWPGNFDQYIPPNVPNSYYNRNLAFQICYVTITINGQNLQNVASKPIYIRIEEGTIP